MSKVKELIDKWKKEIKNLEQDISDCNMTMGNFYNKINELTEASELDRKEIIDRLNKKISKNISYLYKYVYPTEQDAYCQIKGLEQAKEIVNEVLKEE